jgi:hypothetical protein
MTDLELVVGPEDYVRIAAPQMLASPAAAGCTARRISSRSVPLSR